MPMRAVPPELLLLPETGNTVPPDEKHRSMGSLSRNRNVQL